MTSKISSSAVLCHFKYADSSYVITFVLPVTVAARHTWVKRVFSGTGVLQCFVFGFLLS